MATPISNTGTAFRDLPAAAQAAQVDEAAQRIVREDVCYCVSALVSTLIADAFNEKSIMDENDAYVLSRRQPDADDYREAMTDRGIADSRILTGSGVTAAIIVEKAGDTWTWLALDTDHDEAGQGVEQSEADAYREAFDAISEEIPDGSEVYEHWLVTDWLADKLEAHGEAVARDVAGLTIWGRATTGQAIYADGVIQRIARDILEA